MLLERMNETQNFTITKLPLRGSKITIILDGASSHFNRF